jgi:hypothetical protein
MLGKPSQEIDMTPEPKPGVHASGFYLLRLLISTLTAVYVATT